MEDNISDVWLRSHMYQITMNIENVQRSNEPRFLCHSDESSGWSEIVIAKFEVRGEPVDFPGKP